MPFRTGSESKPTGYEETFERRARSYALACSRFPAARETERRLLVDLLEAAPGDTVLDHPAGSGYLADGIASAAAGVRVVCAEPVAAFLRRVLPRRVRVRSDFARLPLRSESVQRVGSLAGLHHVEEKQAFFDECARVLRPGGVLAVADVLVGTPPAAFLDGAVDRWSETGHRGLFFEPGELANRLGKAGLEDAEEAVRELTWDLPSRDALAEFARLLFGMSRASLSTVRAELDAAFAVAEDASGVHLPWTLVYARGRKPPDD